MRRLALTLIVLLTLGLGALLCAQQPAPPPCDEQLRITQTRYDIKKNQAELAEQNIAQLLEQLRQAQAQNTELKGEVEKLKHGAQPAAN